MRIAIYGVGGVGGLIGAHLIRSGAPVAFIARGPHLDAIQSRGLTVSSPKGEMLVTAEIATSDPKDVGIVDLVVLGIKAEQIPGAAGAIRTMLGASSCVLPLQNGVEAFEQLAGKLGENRVLIGLCGMMSWVSGPGHIRTLGDVNFVRLGEADNRRSRRVLDIVAAFNAAGIRTEVPDDIQVALWEKFLFVVSLGGVSAVKRQPFGVVRSDAEARRLLELSMQEIYELALARGVNLAEDVVARTMAFVDELPEEGTASLQRDIADGRPSELESWNGAVVRLGKRSGIPTPVHEFIYGTLLPAETLARARQAETGAIN